MIATAKRRAKAAAEPLTTRQKGVLSFIAQCLRDQGRPPSVREIAEAFDIGSPNGVKCHLDALEAKGWIKRDPNIARGIRLLKVQTLPLVGRVSAGALLRPFAFYEDWSLELLFGDLADVTTATVMRGQPSRSVAAGDTLLMRGGRAIGMLRQVA